MPARYIHLAKRDIEQQVRKDAGIDEHGQRLVEKITENDLDRILRRQLRGFCSMMDRALKTYYNLVVVIEHLSNQMRPPV